MPTIDDLRQKQSMPLNAKVTMTKQRIREWYEHFNGDVYVSFSGGKDSTVLAHLVHSMYPDVPLVFSNTGLEFPEIQSFARKMGAKFIRPKMQFSEVISRYGYPLISKETADTIHGARPIRNGANGARKYAGKPRSNKDGEWLNWRRKALHGIEPFDKGFYCKKRWLPLARETQFYISGSCCNVMKKNPLFNYQKETNCLPYVGTLAEESKQRAQAWLRFGCNAFNNKHQASQPMSFWLEQDVLEYIKREGLEIASVYGEIIETNVDSDGFECQTLIPGTGKLKCSDCTRTGCIFCCFGVYLEKQETRFQRLAKTHPRQYEYCMMGGQWVDNPAYDLTAPKYDDFWENWNPKKIWVPSKEGLGMKKVFDDCNQIYGKDFIRYE